LGCGSSDPTKVKIEFEVVDKTPSSLPEKRNGNGQHSDDELRDILLQCVKDADYVIRNAEGQISDKIQKLATTLFIARTRLN